MTGEHYIDKESDIANDKSTHAYSDSDSSGGEDPDYLEQTRAGLLKLETPFRERIQGTTLGVQVDEGDPSLWELRPSAGKGVGMFARKIIPRGTRLLAEECLFSIPGSKALLLDVEQAVQNLSAVQHKAYMGLQCPDHPGKSPVVRIWEANCFKMGKGAGIFLRASRINHSCTPNAHFAWNVYIQRETVHAMVDILANEEITISYCYPHTDVYHRQQRLEPYGFDCKCDPCSQHTESGRASEAYRCRMAEVVQKIKEIREDPRRVVARQQDDAELHARLELIDLFKKEQLFLIELANQYQCVATCYEYWRDKPKALKYAQKGLQIALWCVGEDSEFVQSSRARIQELEKM